MLDVAREAHVSVKTVSRVVNDEPGVRLATARRVRGVIDELGFHRNDSARLLRRGRTASIGLVVEDLANPFYSQLTAAIEREARLHGCFLISASAEGSATREASIVEAMTARRVDGLVLVPAATRVAPATARALRDAPLVVVDRPVDGLGADTVLSDNGGGIRGAVDHLVAHGHRHLAFLGDSATLWTTRERRAAFVAAHEALGLPGEPRVAAGPYPAAALRDLVEGWSTGSPATTGFVTGNNRVTVAVLHAAHELGLRPALVGYDDFELADLLDPPVTVVHQDPEAMGSRAAQQLFARIAGDDAPPATIVMPTRLVVRESGALPTAAAVR